MKAHNWMATHWKPASAFVYTLICFFDFVVFPAYAGLAKPDLVTLIDQIQGMGPTIQHQIVVAASSGYEPFTLRGSGLFHLAFGALLTGAAIRNGETPGLTYGKRGAEWKRRSTDSVEEDSPVPDAPKPSEPSDKK